MEPNFACCFVRFWNPVTRPTSRTRIVLGEGDDETLGEMGWAYSTHETREKFRENLGTKSEDALAYTSE
jgi:hypothetical protein